MRQNFESLYISWIATIFTFKWLIFFMKCEILIHYFSWIATIFIFKCLFFFIK